MIIEVQDPKLVFGMIHVKDSKNPRGKTRLVKLGFLGVYHFAVFTKDSKGQGKSKILAAIMPEKLGTGPLEHKYSKLIPRHS